MWHFLTRLFARKPRAMVFDLEHERLRRALGRFRPGDGGGAMACSREDAMRRTELK